MNIIALDTRRRVNGRNKHRQSQDDVTNGFMQRRKAKKSLKESAYHEQVRAFTPFPPKPQII